MARRTDEEDAEDRRLWQKVAGTVRPFQRKKGPARKPSEKPVGVKMKPAVASPAPPVHRVPAVSAPTKGFDRATQARLKKGKLALEARLDLHGMSQERAYAALQRFIQAAHEDGIRTVLVITGKGPAGGGVLRRMVPLWLEEGALRRIVLAAVPARARDGGDGALYVRLRNPDRK